MSHQAKRKLIMKNEKQIASNLKELKYNIPTKKQFIQKPHIQNPKTKAQSSLHIKQIITNQKAALKFMQTALLKFQSVTEDLQALLLEDISKKQRSEYASSRSPLNIVDNSDDELTDEIYSSSNEEDFICSDVSKPSSSSTESCNVKRGTGCLEINGKILHYNFIEDDNPPSSESFGKQNKQMLYLKNKNETEGVYCLQRISRGTKITEFVGELQKSVTSAIKYDSSIYEFIFQGRKMCVDASKRESIGKYIRNNDDDPNCEVQIEVADGIPSLIFYSIRDIIANEELTCSYGGESCTRLNYPRVRRKSKNKRIIKVEEESQQGDETFQSKQGVMPSQEIPKEKKTRYSGYSEEAMTNALIECRAGMSLKRAAMLFKVPRSTLSNKFHKKVPEGRRIGRYPFLAKEEEAQIVKWIKVEANRGNIVKKSKILDMAQKMLQAHPERRAGFINGKPGPNWFRLFLKRNPSITSFYERDRSFKLKANVLKEVLLDETHTKQLQEESRNDIEMKELETTEQPDYFGNTKITDPGGSNSEILNLDSSIETIFKDFIKNELNGVNVQVPAKNTNEDS